MSKDRSTSIANVLAAIEQIKRAFGAPGDWGYGTSEGEALYALYRARAELENEVHA